MNGNNCGHLPKEPKCFKPPKQHTRPHIITKLIGSIQQYYSEPSTIPSLNLANGSDRQQRSERREACITVLGCLVHYLDLASLRVGIPQADQSFQGIKMTFIAERTGLTLRRCQRAVSDLVASGLLTVYPLCKKIDDATYKGYAAIRTLNPKLFNLFGLGKWLSYQREKAAARIRKKQRKSAEKVNAKIGLMRDAADVTQENIQKRMAKAMQSNGKFISPADELRKMKEILNPS